MCCLEKNEENIGEYIPIQITSENSEISELIKNYDDLFASPSGLPHQWQQDHFIHLEPNSKSVSVRPYRQSQFQKNEIERLIEDRRCWTKVSFNSIHHHSLPQFY